MNTMLTCQQDLIGIVYNMSMRMPYETQTILWKMCLYETVCFLATDENNYWQIINDNVLQYTNMITRRHYQNYGVESI